MICSVGLFSFFVSASMASLVVILLWAQIHTSSSMYIKQSPSSHLSITSVIFLIVTPSSSLSLSLSGDSSLTPSPGLHISRHHENSRVCSFQLIIGLCLFNQSYPKNISSFPNCV